MANNDYNVDYNDLNSGSRTINKNANEINSIIDKVNREVDLVCDSSSFSGPVADYCLNTWKSIKVTTNKDTQNIASSAVSLDKINEVYQQSDAQVGNDVGDV